MHLFLKLSGIKSGFIKGSSTDKHHPGEIVVDSFSWGLHTPIDALSGLPTGRTLYSTLDFVAATAIDSAPLINSAASNEQVHGDLSLVTTNSSGISSTSTKISFAGGSIVSYHIGASHLNAHPNDGFSITFQKLVVHQTPGGDAFIDQLPT
jgi:type VI secretion system Hcp family effector